MCFDHSDVTMGPQGAKQYMAQKGPIFKPYRARWAIGGPFSRSCGGRNLKLRHCLIDVIKTKMVISTPSYIIANAPERLQI